VDIDRMSDEDLIAYVTAHDDIPAGELQEIGDALQHRQLADGAPDWVTTMWADLMAGGRDDRRSPGA
jgi:hypothetical protein